MPPNAQINFKNQQNLALGLESRLIYYFVYDKHDNRLSLKSFYPGNKSQQHAGFTLFLAIKTYSWYLQLSNHTTCPSQNRTSNYHYNWSPKGPSIVTFFQENTLLQNTIIIYPQLSSVIKWVLTFSAVTSKICTKLQLFF